MGEESGWGALWRTYHSVEFGNLPQQPVLVQGVQRFAGDHVHRPLVDFLVQSRHQQVERLSDSLLGKDAKNSQLPPEPTVLSKELSFHLWQHDRRQEAVFSNSQQEIPKERL